MLELYYVVSVHWKILKLTCLSFIHPIADCVGILMMSITCRLQICLNFTQIWMCDVNGRQSPLEENLSCVLTNGGSIVCWGSMNPNWKQFHVVHVPIQKEKRILNGHVMPRYSLILLYGILLKTCGVLHMHLICLQSKADPLDTNALKMECWQNISSLSNTETYSRTIFPPPHPFKFYLEVKWRYSCPWMSFVLLYVPSHTRSFTHKKNEVIWLIKQWTPWHRPLHVCVLSLCVLRVR